jgi:hypothetical protein
VNLTPGEKRAAEKEFHETTGRTLFDDFLNDWRRENGLLCEEEDNVEELFAEPTTTDQPCVVRLTVEKKKRISTSIGFLTIIEVTLYK